MRRVKRPGHERDAAPAVDAPHPFSARALPADPTSVSPQRLAALLRSDPPPVLLDVRPPKERAIAHLPDDRWIPLEELPRRLAEIPPDRPIVTYDHRGAAAMAAARLLSAGAHRDASSLEGGIDAFARLVEPTLPRYAPDRSDPFTLLQFPRPSTGCLAYLVGDRDTGAAVVIDPGQEVGPYRRAARSMKWTIRAIVETHTHADHLAGHSELHAKTGAPIAVSHRAPAQYPHRSLSEGGSVEFGTLALSVSETPGHTRDHLMLRIGDKAFTGDTLLPGACGRTDLGDGSPELLWESLNAKIRPLSDRVEVLPAHYGPLQGLPPPERFSSTIGVERATNESLRIEDAVAFRAYMTEGWPPKPRDFDAIVNSNLAR